MALMTIQEVADRLNVTRQTVYRMVWDGEIKHVRLKKRYRIKETDLRKFIKKNYQ